MLFSVGGNKVREMALTFRFSQLRDGPGAIFSARTGWSFRPMVPLSTASFRFYRPRERTRAKLAARQESISINQPWTSISSAANAAKTPRMNAKAVPWFIRQGRLTAGSRKRRNWNGHPRPVDRAHLSSSWLRLRISSVKFRRQCNGFPGRQAKIHNSRKLASGSFRPH